ncbi:MAG: dicarboxylate transporter, DctP subunit [Pseudomonadota bacterium]|jgi:TRAP-type mannitol/chloroaromatic compound transport system substrate-binding protein
MNRRALLRHLAATGAASSLPSLVLAAPAVSTTARVQWRMASSFPKSLDTIYGAGEMLARRVSELTNGQFQIRVFAGNELVPALQVFDAVQQGTIECGHTASYYYVGKNKAFAFETCLPFGLTARQQTAWYRVGGGRELIQQFLKPYGVVSFAGGNTGAQMGGWFRRPVGSLAEFKGLKIRIPGIGGEIMSRMGALPQTIGGPDIYPALERGAIDAAEWVGPYDDEKMGFYKVAKYYYFPGWWEAGPQLSFYANAEAFAKLPRAYQVAFEVAASEAATLMLATYDARNPQALVRLINQHHVRLMGYPDDLLKAAQKTAFNFYEEQAADNPAFAKLYASWKPFRRLEGGWFNLAETSLENFMYKNAIK